MRKLEGKWIFLSVLTVVAGALIALAIYALAIRDESGGPAVGPAAPLTQEEEESLERFHLLATTSATDYSAGDVDESCAEVTVIVRTKPFSPYDTSSYESPTLANRWSPLPRTAHWASASDLESLGRPGRLLRQLTIRSLIAGGNDAGAFASAVDDCYDALLPALEAATAQ